MTHQKHRSYMAAALFTLLVSTSSLQGAEEQSPDVTLTWVEKYVTYLQRPDDSLVMTDVHFLAEIIFDGDRDFDAINAALHANGQAQPLATYGGQDKRAFTNGYFYTRKTRSFDTVEALEQQHPPQSTYVWKLDGPAGSFTMPPVRIGGSSGETQIPQVSRIRLAQQGKAVTDYASVRADQPLEMSWDPFTIGTQLEGTDWTDLIFVLVSDCHGNVVYTGGAPGTDDDFVDYTETSAVVPVGRLAPGQDYVTFISQVHYVDHNISDGIEQLAANSFAVELPIRTAGTAEPGTCASDLRPAQYLWTRKTRGEQMESWPTVAEFW